MPPQVASNATVEALANSTVAIASSSAVTNLSGGTLTFGNWRANSVGGSSALIDFQANGTTISNIDASVFLTGADSRFQTRSAAGAVQQLDNTLHTISGRGLTLQNRDFNATANSGNFTVNAGSIRLTDSTFQSNTLTLGSLGLVIGDGGNSFLITNSQVTGSGSVSAGGGTFTVTRGFNITGTTSVGNDATLNLSSAPTASSTRILNLNSPLGTGNATLNLGSQNLTVTEDFRNLAWGVGNAFNARANVTGTGQILASGTTVGQAITGANVTNGTTATPTLTLGNVRVGQSTQSTFQIQNTGTGGGSSLRGAIQNTGLTSGQLSLTAQNWGPIAQGASTGPVQVTFNATTAGALAGQSFAVVNNFDNVVDQTVSVTGTAFNAATGNATPSPSVNLGNFRVGVSGPLTQSFAVSNAAPSGAFSEQLGIQSQGTTGNFSVTNNNAAARIAGGATSNNLLTVSTSGATAGANNGQLNIQYLTDGTGTSGLGTTNANSQAISLQATGYRLAQANTIAAVNFGNVHVGDAVSQALSISNTAANDGFSERLNASFGSATDARITNNGGSISGLNAGATNNTNMTVGLNTASAGAVNGTIRVNLASDGTGLNTLGVTALPGQDVGVSGNIQTVGNVFRLAAPSQHTPEPVNFGARRVGDAAPSQALTISNTAANDGFSERLNASIGGASAGFTASGAFNLLGPQQTDSTSLVVGMNTATAGIKNGTATIALVSDGQGTSNLGQTPLPSQTVNMSGRVYQGAQTSLAPANVDFGTVRRGTVLGGVSLSVTNSAPSAALNDTLVATSFGGAGAGFTSSVSATLAAGLNAGQSGSLDVNLVTSAPGVFNGTALATLVSRNPDMSDLALGQRSVTLSGTVNEIATPRILRTGGDGAFSGGGLSYTLDFGSVLQGSNVSDATLRLLNDVLSGIPADALIGSFDASGVDAHFLLAGIAGPFNLAGGGFADFQVDLNTLDLGSFSSSLIFRGASHNAFQNDLALGDIVINLRGTVVQQGTTVPEPASAALLLVALGALLRARRKAH